MEFRKEFNMMFEGLKKIIAANWNEKNDGFTQMFWDQNTSQFWLEKEIVLSSDKNTWMELTVAEQETFKKVLAGLTLLDTEQGSEGMPLIQLHTKDAQRKAVVSFMGTMEHVHAKSYSSIFTTLATDEEIDALFEWVNNNPLMQYKALRVAEYYRRLFTPDITKYDLYMAKVASVFLESYLFYSGFFYPLYLAGQGKMTASGEIINLIIRDEAIHGVYIGLLAQELFRELTEEEQLRAVAEAKELMLDLYENELAYAEEVYNEIGLTEEVNRFIRYNANKAMMNLALEPLFEDEDINPIVENGLKTDSKNHDFFSVKGNSYVKATNVEKLTDDDFVFNN
jgi:ribonucleoside-diphosphate reductase beta chain